MGESYRDSAELLDIMSHDAWRAPVPHVVEAIGVADPGAGPIVDGVVAVEHAVEYSR